MKNKFIFSALLLIVIILFLTLLYGEFSLGNFLQRADIFKDTICKENCIGIDKGYDWNFSHYLYNIGCILTTILYLYVNIELLGYYKDKLY